MFISSIIIYCLEMILTNRGSFSGLSTIKTNPNLTEDTPQRILWVQNDLGKILQLQQVSQLPELRKLCVGQLRTLRWNSNANLQGFCWILLEAMVKSDLKQDISLILESAMSNPAIARVTIEVTESSNISKLSPEEVQRCIGEFVDGMKPHSGDLKVEAIFNKQPQLIDALTIVLRKILGSYGLPNAYNLQLQIPTTQAYKTLFDYFDLTYRNQKSLFLLYQEGLFIYETFKKQILIGSYFQKIHPDQQIAQNIQSQPPAAQESLRHPTVFSDIRESIITEIDADTPSFNFQQSETSFRSSLVSDSSNMKSSKQIYSERGNETPQSLLKDKDRQTNPMKESLGLFGCTSLANKRAVLERQLRRGLESSIGFEKIMDGAQTAHNTPQAMLQEPFCFKDTRQQCHLNKSSSTKAIQGIDNQKESKDTSLGKSKSQQYLIVQSECRCQTKKKDNNKICSGLFDVSIRCLTEPSTKGFHRPVQTYVFSKGITQQIFQKGLMPGSSKFLVPQNFSKLKHFEKHGLKPVLKGESKPGEGTKQYSSVNVGEQRVSLGKKPIKIPGFLAKRKKESCDSGLI